MKNAGHCSTFCDAVSFGTGSLPGRNIQVVTIAERMTTKIISSSVGPVGSPGVTVHLLFSPVDEAVR